MEKETDFSSEAKRASILSPFIIGLTSTLMVYVLSTGPIVMLADKGVLNRHPALIKFVMTFYSPFDWADHNPLLRTPLRLYWRLWSHRFDNDNP